MCLEQKKNHIFIFPSVPHKALFFFLETASNFCFTLQSLWISLTIHETHMHKLYIKALLPDTPNSIRNRSLWLHVQLVHLFLYVIGIHVGWTFRCVFSKRKITFSFFPSVLHKALFFFLQSASNLCFTLQSLWISLSIPETHMHKHYIKALLPNTPNSIRNRSLWLLVQLVHLFLYVIVFHVGWTSMCRAPQHIRGFVYFFFGPFGLTFYELCFLNRPRFLFNS